MMNKIVFILLVLFVILSLSRTEMYRDNPTSDINDDEFELTNYEKTDLPITHDLIQEMIIQQLLMIIYYCLVLALLLVQVHFFQK